MRRIFCCLGGLPTTTRSQNENQNAIKNKDLLSKTLFSSYKSIDGGLDVSHTKTLTSSFRTKEGLDYVDLEAGKTCDICTIRPKTHFAVPCGHSACLICWTNWLFSEQEELQGQKTMHRLRASKIKFQKGQLCFVCQKRVRTIKRYSYTLAPRHPYEEEEDKTPSGRKREADEGSFRFYEVKLDDGLEDVMKHVLAVKDELRNEIVGKLETVENHLIELDINRASDEEKIVVYSVECITINEIFEKLQFLFTNSFWGKLAEIILTFGETLKNFDRIMDKYDTKAKGTEGETDNESVTTSVALDEQKEAEVKSLTGIKDTLDLALSATSLLPQWTRVMKLTRKVTSEDRLVSSLLQRFSGVGHEGTLNDILIRQTMALVKLSKERMDKDINTLLSQTIPDLVAKVELTILEINVI